MAGSRAPTALAVSDTIYRLLLRLCPAGYRREYGRPMAQAFRDLAREAYGRRGAWGVTALWARILPDTCIAALAEHVVTLKERRAIANLELATAGPQGGFAMRSVLSATAGAAASVGALLAGAVSIWPLYLLALFALTGRLLGSDFFSGLAGRVMLPVAVWAFWATALLSDLGRYMAVSAVGIALAAAALLFGPRRRLLLAVEGLTLVGILAFPWFFHYGAPVVAAPGVTLHVATQPGLLDSVVKAAQGYAEKVPSTYTLVGWSADGVLYYRETVTATQATRTWAYVPGAAAEIVTAPAGIVPSAVAKRESLLERVRAQVYPENAEPVTRPLHVTEDGLASPDGRWAAVVTRHIYGPEDVIVIGLE